jgi:hypothetical protein
MNPQMDVLYMKSFGQVLAIFTRASEPDTIESTPTTFIGDGLHLRGIVHPKDPAIDVVVPPSQLALTRVDLNPAQLLMPRSMCVKDPQNPSALSDFLNAAPPTVTHAAGPPSSLTVTATAVASGTPILALIAAAPAGNPMTITGSFPATGLVTLILPSLPSGTYYAVAFVPGYPVGVQDFLI